jgi:hypothetical protein
VSSIKESASEHHRDWSHGERGLTSHLLGSVSEAVAMNGAVFRRGGSEMHGANEAIVQRPPSASEA